MNKAKSEAASMVRLDKWLWAARLYKTRAIAKHAVESGKVSSGGQKLKPGRDVSVGMSLSVRQGWDERELIVRGLSEQRRGAADAILLYEETTASINKRKELAEKRRLQAVFEQPAAKPDKKDRRLRQQMKHRME